MHRGDIWWSDLPDPNGSSSGYRRPVVIVQADAFTTSRIATVIVAAITSNLRLATAPGNIFLAAGESSLPRDSVINVSQLITLDKTILDTYVGRITTKTLEQLDDGIRLVLDV
jgi:mRNA interferase MazF